MFDSDDAAALFAASHATNGPITSDGTYSGITYYLTHALRGLGDQDTNCYSDIPTSQIYYNSRTGTRTAVIFNPAATSQTATIYSNGTPVYAISVPPGTLTVHASPLPGRFEPTLTRNTQLSWPTVVGNTYQVQWTPAPASNHSIWSNLTGILPGNGATNAIFDPLGAGGARAYQVQEYTTYVVTNIVNGGFEAGTGTNASHWTSAGSELPYRVNTNAHSGAWSMMLANLNPAVGGIQFYQAEQTQGAPAVVPGLAYTFSFWAEQLLNGAGLVQSYNLAWLDGAGGTISSVTASFSGGSGYWSQIVVPGLTAPANAVQAKITFRATTGNTANPAGEVLIDDVLLTTSAPGPSYLLPVTVQPGWQVSWPSANYVTYGVERAAALGPANVWTDLGSSFTGTGATLSVFDTLSTNQFQFYRVYAQP